MTDYLGFITIAWRIFDCDSHDSSFIARHSSYSSHPDASPVYCGNTRRPLLPTPHNPTWHYQANGSRLTRHKNSLIREEHMKGIRVIAAVLALFALTSALAFADDTTVTLTQENNSGQNGTAM